MTRKRSRSSTSSLTVRPDLDEIWLCSFSDGWEAWPDHSDDDDHEEEVTECVREDISIEPKLPVAKEVIKTVTPADKLRGKGNGHHDHHHHRNGREKKAKIARAH
jgi:hypothetical protein